MSTHQLATFLLTNYMFRPNSLPMSPKNPLVISVEIPEALKERILPLVKSDKRTTSTEDWLTARLNKFVERLAAQDTDMQPKEAAAKLGVGMWTIRRLMKEGHFPGMYHVNPRVIRIPEAEVEAYKQARTREATG